MKTHFYKGFILTVTLFSLLHKSVAQTNTFPKTGSAGIGTATPNASALLDMESTTQGLLIPQMTTAQRNAIASPATGLLIYQTNGLKGFYYYSGTAWTAVVPKAKGWSLTGNAGTTSSDYIGTSDAQPLRLGLDGVTAGIIDFNYNASFGQYTLGNNTGTNNNSAFGYGALFSNTAGNGNSAFGSQALIRNSGGPFNTALGGNTLSNNTTGNLNIAAGYNALFNNNGSGNTAIGGNAMLNNLYGNDNVAIGIAALYNSTMDGNEVAIGDSAMYNIDFTPNNGINTSFNTAIGSRSLFSETGSGTANTAVGSQTLYTNNGGLANCALGTQALFANTTGNYNTATGFATLYFNTTGGDNTATGFEALSINSTGTDNTATGFQALHSSTSNANTADGFDALVVSTGYNNTAVGYQSLLNATGAADNVGIGVNALMTDVTTGTNTAVGTYADVNADGYTNANVFGYSAVGTASNQVRIGNSSVTSIGGYKAWTNLSDGRIKINVQQNVPGLAFINLLKPVTYNLDLEAADKIMQHPAMKDSTGKVIRPTAEEAAAATAARTAQEQVVCTGFIAQDVEASAKKIGYDFDGVDAAKNSKDLYGLRYSEFVVPLVKGMQELSQMNDAKDSVINAMQQQINELKTVVQMLADKSGINLPAQNASLSSASLQQNIPNPYNSSTTIRYTLPAKFISAQITVTDNTGKVLKQIPVSASDGGSVNIDATSLSAGTYSYSLIVDGSLIDTKKMVLAK